MFLWFLHLNFPRPLLEETAPLSASLPCTYLVCTHLLWGGGGERQAASRLCWLWARTFLTGIALGNHTLFKHFNSISAEQNSRTPDRWDYLWKRPHPDMCWSQWWPKCHQSCQRPWAKSGHLFQPRSLLLAKGAWKAPQRLETQHLWQNWAAGYQTLWPKEIAHHDDLRMCNNASFFYAFKG